MWKMAKKKERKGENKSVFAWVQVVNAMSQEFPNSLRKHDQIHIRKELMSPLGLSLEKPYWWSDYTVIGT